MSWIMSNMQVYIINTNVILSLSKDLLKYLGGVSTSST